jgi:hypothetical protein
MTIRPLPGHVHRVGLTPAACSLDLSDGSERSEYVGQDYILSLLGRPHRYINLIYCYYPLDKGWPKRVSNVFKNKGGFIWGYPYDDYFPYSGGLSGDPTGPVFQQMRDIRRHGQDVSLTLTADCAISDDQIKAVARDLRPFGKMRLRLNHECDGFWFAFNRRYSYEEVARFFVRFARIVRTEAPLVRMVSCWGSVPDYKTSRLIHEKELAPMLPVADVWATDKYLSLHFGWPFKSCEPADLDKTYSAISDRDMWFLMETTHKRFAEMTGEDKGLEIGEFNVDGSVGGLEHQSRRAERFYRRILKEKPPFLKGITYYQFRDRARLGLERENPNDPTVGLPSPFLPVYKELIQQPHFLPKEHWSRLNGAATLEWRAADDSDGLGWRIPLKSKPVFLELLFGKNDNLMIHAGDDWFYKKPGVEWVDVTLSAGRWRRAKPFPLSVFAPPADGMNPGGASSFATRLKDLPQMRLLYEWRNAK